MSLNDFQKYLSGNTHDVKTVQSKWNLLFSERHTGLSEHLSWFVCNSTAKGAAWEFQITYRQHWLMQGQIQAEGSEYSVEV